MKNKDTNRRKVAVIGGGTGLSVILRGLKRLDMDISAIVTVADDGGSSGKIRDFINIVPPGDMRNCIGALAGVDNYWVDLFQYRFDTDDDFLSGHAIGNLLIAALKEINGSITSTVELLSQFMEVKGQILPVAEDPLVLNALFEDGSCISGESKIGKQGKKIKKISLSTMDGQPAIKASPKVVEAINEADLVVLGPGSLYTSILPNLMVEEVGSSICNTQAEVVYICNIMTQMGETEEFSDYDHVRVLHKHLGKKFIDTVLVNIDQVPEELLRDPQDEEYLLPVAHDFQGLRSEGCRVISADFLSIQGQRIYHDTDKIVQELSHLLDTVVLSQQRSLVDLDSSKGEVLDVNLRFRSQT